MTNKTEVKYVTGSSSFLSLLTVAFVVLKLCGIITWSWWWVLSPIWIPIAIVILLFIILFIWYLAAVD